ncbi:hypothetical protein AKJ09_08162 [Labilithrix luteola]|uniref:Uncharacterized protein n=1 Tax=Labilithrix luteola TaxID=1391654 RepID=A0A0K1Q702_9BACT|nr:hypothetical protein [Labilithrix luteola]AKV01499.1 hypothetical protein AKJ09_08162 [Labilithrix luteola]
MASPEMPMSSRDTRDTPEPARERGPAPASDAFGRAKRQLVIAAAGIALGLGVSGSLDRTAGGVLVLASWLLGIVALHRLGRSGRG